MKKICVIGLGYVGLPLAVEFAKKRPVVGFDIKPQRIKELNEGHDPTLEVSDEDLKSVLVTSSPSVTQSPSHSVTNKGLFITNQLDSIHDCQIYIIAVPTPVDKNNRPDLTPLVKASETVGKVLKDGDIVIYESTVYPGATEEDCVPVLEKTSGKKMNEHFFVGYSPERINPGDKLHTLTTIKKVTSGSTPEIGQEVDALYREIIVAGTHLAPSIKVAEAAKVIENSQRDINIAFVNELSKIFNLMGIDTHDVLDAAGTKWNFLPFKPGLVGGHCIPLDPFYLEHIAKKYDFELSMIHAAGHINMRMPQYMYIKIGSALNHQHKSVSRSKVLFLGVAYKPDIDDARESPALEIMHIVSHKGGVVTYHDPFIPEVRMHDGSVLRSVALTPDVLREADVVVLTTNHSVFDVPYIQQHANLIVDLRNMIPGKNENVYKL